MLDPSAFGEVLQRENAALRQQVARLEEQRARFDLFRGSLAQARPRPQVQGEKQDEKDVSDNPLSGAGTAEWCLWPASA